MSVATNTSPSLQVQPQFLPIDIVDLVPNDTGSADMIGTGTGIDNREYAIKKGIPCLEFIPAVEMFCHELCRLLFIPIPNYEVVRLPSGELAFGSQWDGGVLPHDSADHIQRWILDEECEHFKQFDMIGRIFGLDLFLNNIDRHWNNYLITRGKTNITTLAFDFGRALFNMPGLGYNRYDTFRRDNPIFTNTADWQYRFVHYNFHVHEEAERTLDQIAMISKSAIQGIFTKMPIEWLPTLIRENFVDWWGSDEFNTRIDRLKSRGLER